MLGDMVDDETKPPQAADLSDGGRREELERRGLKPTGFPEDDIKLLQKALNAECEQEREAKIAERRDALAKRRAEEEALRMQRFLEKQVRVTSTIVELLASDGLPGGRRYCCRLAPDSFLLASPTNGAPSCRNEKRNKQWRTIRGSHSSSSF